MKKSWTKERRVTDQLDVDGDGQVRGRDTTAPERGRADRKHDPGHARDSGQGERCRSALEKQH
jgi:hypothetical protein